MPKGQPGSWEHGTESGYRRCRRSSGGACQDCRNAHSAYNAEHRAAPTTASRRIRRADPTKPKAGYCTATTLEELLNAW
jgi:hypothetical protein